MKLASLAFLASNSGCDSAKPQKVKHLNGEKETEVGQLLVELLKARARLGSDLDETVFSMVRLQCKNDPRVAQRDLSQISLARLYPLDELPRASFAFCGWFLLNDGEAAYGAELPHSP